MDATVTLRAKKTKTKGYSLYLDIYYGPTAKDRKAEYLGRYVSKDYTKSTSNRIKKEDRLDWEVANEIFEKRRKQVRSQGYQVAISNIKNKSFLKHFEEVRNRKQNASYDGAYTRLQAFIMHENRTDLKVKELRPGMIRKLKDYLLAELSKSTVRTYFVRYSIAYNELELNNKNPFSNKAIVVTQKQVEAERTQDYLSLEQQAKLISTDFDGMKDIDKLAFLFSCCTGLRYGDVRDITWNDVKEDRIEKKTEKSKGTKTAVIPFHENLVNILDQLDRSSKKLFPGLSDNGTINYKLKDWQKAAKIELEKEMHFHMGRHSFATNQAKEGANVAALRAMMTHSNIEQTLKYYSDGFEEKQEAVDKLNKTIFKWDKK